MRRVEQVPTWLRRLRKTVGTAAIVGLIVGLVLGGVPDNQFGNVMVCFVAALSWLFCLLYGVRSDWRATQPGRSIMYAVASLGAVTTQVSLSLWWQDYPLRADLRAVIYTGLALTVLNMIVVLLLSQRREDADGKYKWW